MRTEALIAFEDGRVFRGESFTGPGEAVGEVVFNTSMTGYQEILTDPSYKGQMVTMTYPLIGNYGVNPEDVESAGIHMSAFIVREYIDEFSNWRATESLGSYLSRHGVLGIHQVDTRAITRHVRLQGAMKAAISTHDLDADSLVEKARRAPDLVGRDLVKEVVPEGPWAWTAGRPEPVRAEWLEGSRKGLPGRFRVAVIDCGLKYNQLRILERLGCHMLVFPAGAGPEEILASEPDGIFLSNGPGDPAAVPYVAETVKALLGRRPIFGICLGHQILSLALGGKTYKLKFGHHGGNQPVKDLETGRIEITAQNHGFAVDPESLPLSAEVTHINLNDRTVEGIRDRGLRAFSVQYHPENAPGPHDAEYLFSRFTALMEGAA